MWNTEYSIVMNQAVEISVSKANWRSNFLSKYMSPKSSFQSKLATQNQLLLRTLNALSVIGTGCILVFAGIMATTSSEGVESSSYAISDDQDQDNIPNWDDFDDDNDGIPDTIECGYIAIDPFVNGGFETPGTVTTYKFFSQSQVTGWNTTATNGKIELWTNSGNSPFNVPPDEGDQFAELNASQVSTLYQAMSFNGAGGTLSWSVSHRGRSGVDVARVKIGPTLETSVEQVTMTDGKTAWGNYSGTYDVEPGVTSLTFAFEAVSAAGGSSVGNFIDNINITLTQDCLDLDGDGLPNSLDLDSDGDGISDIIEAGGTDPDGDGQVEYATPGDPMSMVDTDLDGVADEVDNVDSGSGAGEYTSGSPWSLPNSDAFGNTDYIDIDADDDGITDNAESQSTDGYKPPSGVDTDGDGIDDAYDVDCQPCGGITGSPIVPANSDVDPKPDYIDLDSDGDGIPDSIEGHDTNGDQIVDGNDSPISNTGLPGDNSDVDNDGLLDGYDNNISLDNYDATNGNITGESYADVLNSTGERAWRESSSLPVEWLAFNATIVGNDAQLDWSTAAELNSDYFEIERSEDGVTFEPVGMVPSVGTTTDQSNYQFVDLGITAVGNAHFLYRLRQVDFNGTFDFSKTVEIQLEPGEDALILNTYPNPVSDILTVNMEYQEASQLRIVSMNGQVLYAKSLDPNQISQEVQVPVSDWAAGVYSAILISNGRRKTRQIIVK